MLTRRMRDSILALLVLIVPPVLWLTVDEELLDWIAFIVLGLGVAGVFVARNLLERLDQAGGAAYRRTLLESVAMGFAVSALIAFILLILMYAD